METVKEITNENEANERIIRALAEELGQNTEHVRNVVTLLDEGNTVPFIARYRKEICSIRLCLHIVRNPIGVRVSLPSRSVI